MKALDVMNVSILVNDVGQVWYRSRSVFIDEKYASVVYALVVSVSLAGHDVPLIELLPY